MFQFYRDSVLRVYNEWYKWPEDPDWAAAWPIDGAPAVPMSKSWSRARYTLTSGDSSDFQVDTTGDLLDVRTLARTQARFRSSIKREVLSFNRWMELIKETYNGDGSREVDQVPIMLDQTEVGVNPREMPA